jgi:hypothetical protein
MRTRNTLFMIVKIPNPNNQVQAFNKLFPTSEAKTFGVHFWEYRFCGLGERFLCRDGSNHKARSVAVSRIPIRFFVAFITQIAGSKNLLPPERRPECDHAKTLGRRSSVVSCILLVELHTLCRRFIKAMDLLVVPLFNEWLSNVVLEGMARGVPALTDACGPCQGHSSGRGCRHGEPVECSSVALDCKIFWLTGRDRVTWSSCPGNR